MSQRNLKTITLLMTALIAMGSSVAVAGEGVLLPQQSVSSDKIELETKKNASLCRKNI